MEPKTCKGKISQIRQKEKNYFIEVDKVWYSEFGQCPWKEGQEVEFQWVQNGDWKNIIRDTPKQARIGVGFGQNQLKAAALQAAVAFVVGMEVEPEGAAEAVKRAYREFYQTLVG